MNPTVFVDTSAWYALIDSDDTHHHRATRCLRSILEGRQTLLTTNRVVGETYTLLRVRLGAPVAREFLMRTRDSTFTRRVFVLEPWEDLAEAILAQYQDQDFSYVDATSFAAMRHLGLQEAFAFDQHFAIAGFTLIEDPGQPR